jgi:single-stranded DNA-binding protein
VSKLENVNEICLRGILRDVEHSHDIDGISFNKAKIITKRPNGKEDILNLRFKSFSNPHKEGDEVCFKGNVRSYSYQNEEGGNKVVIYVFTYFDEPEDVFERDNIVKLSGRICKTNDLRKTRSGKHNIHFIVANNLTSSNSSKRLNSYIPCIAWGKTAQQLSELSVNAKVNLIGELHSREHTKTYEDGTKEIRVAHELLVESFEVVE